jgi:hypothetical protein
VVLNSIQLLIDRVKVTPLTLACCDCDLDANEPIIVRDEDTPGGEFWSTAFSNCF